MEATTTQETTSISQRTKLGTEGLLFLLPWIATMGYCHYRQFSWGAASHRSDLRGKLSMNPFYPPPPWASHHNTLGRELPYEALKWSAPSWMKGSTLPWGDGLASHVPMATSQGNATPRDSSVIIHVSHSLSMTPTSKTHGAASTTSDHQSQALAQGWPIQCTTRGDPITKGNECSLGAVTDHKSCPGLSPKGARTGSWLCCTTMWGSGCQRHSRSESLCTATIKEAEAAIWLHQRGGGPLHW